MSSTTKSVAPTAGTGAVRYQEQIVTSAAARKVLAVSRIVIGFTFLWAFVDKTFGLGFATPAERAWINGGTPAQGFITNIEGPFADFFQVFANPFGDVLFMVGLLGIGVALVAGAGLRIAAVTGTLLLAFMYLAELPAALGGNNPVVDSHWHEALLLIIAAVTLSGDTWGVGKIWARIVGNSWLR
ncbi:DoxX family protein [uncultured Cellulomonas sp.]|uniref:DoxX family protein n=1 Tax=uncultured Cellulomonas sp. TaxID=189682 RepID=UPI0026331D3B|nr:DoxX family protein [uncultured Cellulomonas sp.]